MKNRLSLLIFVIALNACSTVTAAQQGKIPPTVWERIRTTGTVRVIVQLKLLPGDKLTKDNLESRQLSIEAAQAKLLAELADTNYKITARYKNLPSLALELGPDGLDVLERSEHVLNVSEDASLLRPSHK
jgi:hypothetical protein